MFDSQDAGREVEVDLLHFGDGFQCRRELLRTVGAVHARYPDAVFPAGPVGCALCGRPLLREVTWQLLSVHGFSSVIRYTSESLMADMLHALLIQFFDVGVVDGIIDPPAIAARFDDAVVLERVQLVGDRRLGHLQAVRDVLYPHLAAGQRIQ